ncbi:MAG: hypothetical protein P8Y76_08985 [bacterium]
MAASSTQVDFRALPEREQPLALIAHLDHLGPGEVLELRTAESPEFLLQRVNLRLRGALAWDIERGAEAWLARVQRNEETPPRDVLDLLQRDHQRLDTLLGRALRQLNASALAAGDSPALETMLHEHRDLLAQLAAVESGLRDAPAGAPPEAWELEPFVALLTGTLAKHEHREESTVFPVWARRHASLSEEAAAALLEQVQDVLYAP